MTVYRRITWLPDVLRKHGLIVVEHDGWRTRGLSESLPFDPRWVVWHHDASAPGNSPAVPEFMIRNFSTAAAQLWVDRAGRWHIIASGRAPHAGFTLEGKPTNFTSIGVETDHTTGEDWPPALLTSLRTGTAAILTVLGSGAEGLEFHKTICDPPGRKTDPAGLDLADERRRVAALILPEDDMTLDQLVEALKDEDSPLSVALRGNVRIAVQRELEDERQGENPGQ